MLVFSPWRLAMERPVVLVCGRMDGMKRFRRIVLNGLTVLSLGLALLVAGSWVRSHWRYEMVAIMSDDRRVISSFSTPRGSVACNVFYEDSSDTAGFFEQGFNYISLPATDAGELQYTFIGCSWGQTTITRPIKGVWTGAFIPHAYLLALFATLPAIRLYRRLRRRHLALPGHCIKCGYDLRATPHRCPECGIDAPAAVARSV
jgi:hypothetical protein